MTSNKSFLRGAQEFKAMLLSKLSPKRSFQEGEYVTGEGKLTFLRQVHDKLLWYLVSLFPVITSTLASLVNIYVAALNTPGMIPSVQSARETFVYTKCTEAKCAARPCRFTTRWCWFNWISASCRVTVTKSGKCRRMLSKKAWQCSRQNLLESLLWAVKNI